jgi:hypothetical protein
VGVTCLIEVDDLRLQEQKSFEFVVCPRVGELIALPSRSPNYTDPYLVTAVEHVPDGVDNGKPAHIVLHIEAASSTGEIRGPRYAAAKGAW